MDLRDPNVNMDAGPSDDVAHAHDIWRLLGKYVSIGDQECAWCYV